MAYEQRQIVLARDFQSAAPVRALLAREPRRNIVGNPFGGFGGAPAVVAGNWQDYLQRMAAMCAPIGIYPQMPAFALLMQNPNLLAAMLQGQGACPQPMPPAAPNPNMPPGMPAAGNPGMANNIAAMMGGGVGYGTPCAPGQPRWTQIQAQSFPNGGVGAGLTTDAIVTVKAPFKGEVLKIPATIAPDWRIVGILVGATPLLISSGEIDGEVYSSDQSTAGRLPCPWAQTNTIFTFTCRNVSGGNQPGISLNYEGLTVTPQW